MFHPIAHRTRLSFMACVLALPAAALATDFPESTDPNNSKAEALAVGPFILAAGDSITGTATTGDLNDYFLVKTTPAALGIYRHRLVLTSNSVGYTATIRSLSQTAAAAAVWPGTVGVVAGADSLAQTATGGILQWYGFGRAEQLYVRMTGTAATTEPYTLTLETEPITAVTDCGVWQPGAITITSIPPGHGNDVDCWVYDSNFNPIPGCGNDGASTNSGHTANFNTLMYFRRHFEPGTYYILASNFDLQNNLASPCDDNRRTGFAMDFPDSVVASSATAPVNVHFTMSDSLGSTNFADGLVITQINSTKANPFEVRFHKFVVGGATAGACCFSSGACAITNQGRCEVALAGGTFNGPGSTCTACPPPAPGVWIDRAPAPYARIGGAGALIGSTFYNFSGSNASSFRSTECFKYDIINDTWSAIAPMPHSGSVAPQLGGASNFDAAAIGTDIYMVGGFIGPAATVPPLSRLLKYDTLANTWTEIATDPYPTPIYNHGVCAADGKLYVISGATLASPLTYTAACYVYDPAGAPGTRWTAIAPIPSARAPSVVTIGSKIYAMASGDAGADASRVDEYDIATNTWTQLTNLGSARGACAVYELGGKPYAVMGGISTYLATTEYLDAGAWTAGPSAVHGLRSVPFDGNAQWLIHATGYNGVYRAYTEILRQAPATGEGVCCNPTTGACTPGVLQADCSAPSTWDGSTATCGAGSAPCPQPPSFCCRGTTCRSLPAGTCTGVVAGSQSTPLGTCGPHGSLATCCFADYDHSGTSTIDDLFIFINLWLTSSPYTKINGDTLAVPSIDDLFIFINLWLGGCQP